MKNYQNFEFLRPPATVAGALEWLSGAAVPSRRRAGGPPLRRRPQKLKIIATIVEILNLLSSKSKSYPSCH